LVAHGDELIVIVSGAGPEKGLWQKRNRYGYCMPRRPAHITQADIARAIRAAKQAGAAEVEVRIEGRDAIIIRMAASAGIRLPLEESRAEIVL
jgi:hypothetical protein